MNDTTLQLDGRTVAFADYGPGDGMPVLWCHGGPGSRFEPATVVDDAVAAGFRIVGIDRPGYGGSTAVPGRTIAGWVADGLAVADALGIDQFIAVGVSTGGAYALALAASAPDRVRGVVACCALTDMRWAQGKAMVNDTVSAVWRAADRDHAIEAARGIFGDDGTGMANLFGTLSAPDQALLSNPAFLTATASSFAAMFAQGVVGYVDDRLADGPGWESFDVGAVDCPVIVLHGSEDNLVPAAQAEHTAKLVPGAELQVRPGLGHFGIITEVVPALSALGRA